MIFAIAFPRICVADSNAIINININNTANAKIAIYAKSSTAANVPLGSVLFTGLLRQ